MENKFDVIVAGAGHAGIEAAHIAAKMGASTLLVTLDKEKIGVMPCNPSVGGLGKGHIVFEISALGGLMPILCTKTYLQARMLNTRKGPAVQGLRLQIDKYAYASEAREALLNTKNLQIHQDMVIKLITDEKQSMKKIIGIECKSGAKFLCNSLVITSGTYLNGVIHIGDYQRKGGKDDSESVESLTSSIESAIGLKLGRLKTGTPPRLLRESVDFSKLTRQPAHILNFMFEFDPITTEEKQPCYIAYTNEKTDSIIRSNLKKSARFSGNITGIGPRYCPSIEDKIARFPDRMEHHVFIEPEGGDNSEVYPAGLSTSLPLEIQKAYINSIIGLENAVITKPGYAIEYDFVQPKNLLHSLEAKSVKNLFFAGQINGTTGYEEAAGQGIIAGINAVLKCRNQEPFVLSRTESYMGIMIDDIVSLGIDEPYRMFTSRAERRLLLRQDNVFLRLTPYAKKLGTISDEMYEKFLDEKAYIEKKISESATTYRNLDFSPTSRAELTIHAELIYAGYIEKERKEAAKAEKFHSLNIPSTMDYRSLSGLTRELQEKLIFYEPKNIAQAQLIPGMTPAAISILIFQIRFAGAG